MTRNKAAQPAFEARQLLRAAVFVGCVLSVFLLPFLFPPATGISMSYRVGFSNRAAIATLLVATLSFALWTRGWGLHLPRHPAESRKHRVWTGVVVGGAIALVGLLSVGMWLRVPWSAPGLEAYYFLDRYAMVALGYLPFRSMTFDYGPLLLYPAIAVHAATHLPLPQSYFLCWVLQWVLGTALLWDTLRRLPAAPVHRLVVFAALVVLFLPMLYSGGSNYTPLRYLLAPWFAVLVWQVQRRSMWAALLLAFLGFSVTLLYSPEQGVALAIATLVFFAVCVRTRAVVAPLLAFCVATLAMALLAAHAGWLQSILDFGGGGYDFPLLLNTRNLLLVALLVVAGCAVIRSFYDRASDRPENYLVAIALVLLPAALGRADSGHLFLNTLPALAVALLVLWATPVVRVPAMVLTLGVVLHSLKTEVVPGFYFTFGPHLAAHARQMLQPPPGGDSAAIAAERLVLDPIAQRQPRGTLFAPLGYQQQDVQTRPLPIATGRFFGFGLVSERFPQAKIAEIEQRRDTLLLLPVNYRSFCWTPDANYIQGVLRDVLRPWYVPTVKHTGNAALPMCLYLRAHYVAAAQPSPVPGFVLVQRTDAFRSSR